MPATPRKTPSRSLRLALALAMSSVLAHPFSAGAAPMPLALDEAVRLAVDGNLGLRATAFNLPVANAALDRAKSVYDRKVDASLSLGTSRERSAATAGSAYSAYDESHSFGVSGLLPSGATVGGALSGTWRQADTGYSLLSPRSARSTLSGTVSQPLLKGLGKEMTEREITLAAGASESTADSFRTNLLQVVTETRTRYIALVRARENLETISKSLEVAKRVHVENQARVKAGVLPPIDLLDSEFGVSGREKLLLEATLKVSDDADRLRVFIQAPPDAEIIPTTPMETATVAHPVDDDVRTALARRPDVAAARVDLRTASFRARTAENLLLPSLAMTGEVGVTREKDDYGRALESIASGSDPFVSVGVAFSFPLGNGAAKADLASDRARAGQASALLREAEETAALDVRAARRTLESSEKGIDVAAKGVRVAEERFESYLKRQKVGLATTKNVLEAEADVVSARFSLAAAKADNQSALTLLWQATGELLERHGLRAPTTGDTPKSGAAK